MLLANGASLAAGAVVADNNIEAILKLLPIIVVWRIESTFCDLVLIWVLLNELSSCRHMF